ncbi:MAG: hypothetical protein U0441_00710 [Polyangiaceae bacterium]
MKLLHRTLTLLPILLFALPACTNDASSSGAGGSTSTAQTLCDAMGDSCLAKQRICVEGGDSAMCAACPEGKYATENNTCDPIPGTPMSHDFSDFTVKSGQEVKGLCQSWTLHNPTELWINTVELTQGESSHHSNWTYVPDDKFTGEDGVWNCDDRNYTQLSAALVGGVLYAQSTQATHEVQKFPNSAAVRIPPYARIIGDVHLLNTTQDDITGHANLKLYALDEADVKVKLTPFHMVYTGLAIPPHATSRFFGSCDLDSKFAANDSPFKMDIYFVLPHYHALGKSFFLDVVGGKQDGEHVFEIGAFDGEAHGRAYDPPFSVNDATGLSFGCDFTNPRDDVIHYGLGDQEMCEMLGFADSTVAFESDVKTAEADGADGTTQLYTGPCSTLAFKWDQNKAGGKGP